MLFSSICFFETERFGLIVLAQETAAFPSSDCTILPKRQEHQYDKDLNNH